MTQVRVILLVLVIPVAFTSKYNSSLYQCCILLFDLPSSIKALAAAKSCVL